MHKSLASAQDVAWPPLRTGGWGRPSTYASPAQRTAAPVPLAHYEQARCLLSPPRDLALNTGNADRSPTLLPSSGTSEAEVHTTSTVPQSATEFVDSLRLPLEVPLIKALPHARVARNAVDCWAPRRSDRLAANSAFRDPQPERQAKRVLVNKWTRRPETVASCTPDATIAARFHNTFTEPLSSSNREAMRELFPVHGDRVSQASARRL